MDYMSYQSSEQSLFHDQNHTHYTDWNEHASKLPCLSAQPNIIMFEIKASNLWIIETSNF